MADFAVYFHRYLHSCISECSIVPRLQGILYQLMFVPSFLTLDLPLTLALCRYIREMHKAYTTKKSLDIDTINTLLAVFGTPTFRISSMNFFWEKLLTTIGTSFVTTFIWSEKEWKITGYPLSCPEQLVFSFSNTRNACRLLVLLILTS